MLVAWWSLVVHWLVRLSVHPSIRLSITKSFQRIFWQWEDLGRWDRYFKGHSILFLVFLPVCLSDLLWKCQRTGLRSNDLVPFLLCWNCHDSLVFVRWHYIISCGLFIMLLNVDTLQICPPFLLSLNFQLKAFIASVWHEKKSIKESCFWFSFWSLLSTIVVKSRNKRKSKPVVSQMDKNSRKSMVFVKNYKKKPC